ncbi:MAG: DUF4430 domain-containing protein [Peptococcaceae bacterium]|nr:DUF4430 domain-containing protein [Peptococcaceae bacterium]
MKRKAIYLIVFLILLGTVAIPAALMNKVFSADKEKQQVAVTGINNGEQGSVPGENDGNTTPDGLTGLEADPANPDAQQGPTPSTDGLINGMAKVEQQAASPPAATATNTLTRENGAPSSAGDAAVTAPAVEPEKGFSVGIAVVGKEGEQLYKAGHVLLTEDNKWGANALGALEATGLPYVNSPTWRSFVYSICGQANHGVTGWMYSVNGDAPMHMADKHPVKAGDKVIWWYSHSMEQPQPRWEELTQ